MLPKSFLSSPSPRTKAPKRSALVVIRDRVALKPGRPIPPFPSHQMMVDVIPDYYTLDHMTISLSSSSSYQKGGLHFFGLGENGLERDWSQLA